MALVPRILPLQFVPDRRVFHRRNRSARVSASVISDKSSAIVWFKHDLRVDDHPGLVAASEYKAVVPVYVFDHRILAHYPDEMLELVLFSLEELRKSLKEHGSNLMIRFGEAEYIMSDLARKVLATNIYAEEEVEYGTRRLLDIVKQRLEKLPSLAKQPGLTLWRTPFYEMNNLKELPASWEDFKKLNLLPTSPVPARALPGSGSELGWGTLPTFGDLKEYMNKYSYTFKDGWIEPKSAVTILRAKHPKSKGKNKKGKSESTTRKKLDKSLFVTQQGDSIGGGTDNVLNALAAYLRYMEGTAREDWQEIHERVRHAEGRDGASFYRLFGSALRLGIVSRRRVHYEAIKYNRERNAGFLSPFSYSARTVAAAVDSVCSMEWYWLMARKSQTSGRGRFGIRIWRWKGYLVHYTVVGDEGPAVLLVHGFGAFLEHYRDNIHNMANSKNRVWAITILGFGKSEKPNVVYTELLWAELLRDFIIEVVSEPVHLVGNSIAGFFIALVASFWPTLVESVVLLNSAGNVSSGYSQSPIARDRRTSAAARFGARLLLLFLRWNVRGIVKAFYPTNTQRADEWLINEMLRASQDPGALVVLESIFSFDLSLPLNYLLEGSQDKVLIIQGMKDPLTDSKSKLAALREQCPGIVIKELDAGHCPHDELPEEVNSIICKWIASVRNKVAAASFYQCSRH